MRRARRSCIRWPSSIFGGLISATLLDTLVTPLLFYRFGRKALERLVAADRAPGSTPGPMKPAEVF